MKKFEAKTLEEAYELAKSEFKCSITNLEIEVDQQPRKGFLGLGRKSAIIRVIEKNSKSEFEKRPKEKHFRKKDIKIEDVSEKIENACNHKSCKETKTKKPLNKVTKVSEKEKIFDNFYEVEEKEQISQIIIRKDSDEILTEVKKGIDSLFSNTCYEIDDIKVEFYDEETLYIEFTGEDSALLIGKEGYRYKALSYILFNWINEKYGLMLRLEVAQFLKNQEEAIYNYLEPAIETIKEKGSFKTKPLDGILVHIALKRLRDEFPNKYVAVKTNVRGDRYVLVNEYRSKEE
ncbi:Jag N-terminal domain-containing protein [Arcobacter sp. CECT 8985]|uniref:Jag N-terminal domain-containing protein n=1 Tax=Arcobacter sp. CECT 8985 TaxID=1935424 RepID=UPI00100BE802|nr:Jag N-terminal domain-containing protein [Arcobacter sp. CECT 8985]RXJ86594.1 hypothetical protein CRU93_07910 [Arcobacter sp. CECT 8985]